VSRQGIVEATTTEWIKFRTVRSTLYTLASAVALSVGIGALISWAQRQHWPEEGFAEHHLFDPTAISLSGFFFAEIAIGVIGVLIITSEYTSGSIRSTLTATPHRVTVLAAKALVLFAATVVVGEICSFASFFVGQAILSGVTPTATLTTPGALRAVLLAGLSLALLALLALGIGTMLRHTAGSITVYVSLLLVLLLVVLALPMSWNRHVFKFLPEILAESMRSGQATSEQYGTLFSPFTSALVLAGYALAALAAGAALLVRRDA
jgi:ABC-2 type transport system permease protein